MSRDTGKSSPKQTTDEAVTAYKYAARRKNIPPAGLEAHGSLSVGCST
jgi:hypothetical protein